MLFCHTACMGHCRSCRDDCNPPQGQQVVPSNSSWKFGDFDKKFLPRVAKSLEPYCRDGWNARWASSGVVSWCLWDLMAMALDRHRDKQSMNWHGFFLEPEEEQAVWQTAFAMFHGDASSMDVDRTLCTPRGTIAEVHALDAEII